MNVRGRGGLVSRVDAIFARFAVLSLSSAGPLSSGIWWADPTNHARAFRCRTRLFSVAGEFLALTTVNALLEWSDADLADIALNGTGQIVTCKVRLVDADGAPITGAECSAVFENSPTGQLACTSLIETCAWGADDVPCGVEAVLEAAAGSYGTLSATWELPAKLPLVFGA